jgi:quercetin dioxygenase-like cupin family protein
MPKEPIKGDGWALSSIDDLGEGPGFRKVRAPLDITAFGVNVIVLPPSWTTPRHTHERQQELYLVLDGEIEFDLGGTKHTVGRGGLVKVDPGTMRCLHNTSDAAEATYFAVGGADGYVGRDGVTPD